MLQQQRHDQILAKLNLEGQVRVKDLSREFNVTEDCIRKDLTILENANKLKRIHGGAMQVRVNPHTLYVNERKDIRVNEKKIIAKKAIELIAPGSTIFLDISTSSLELAKLIYQRNLNVIVVTNMIDIMSVLSQKCKAQLIFIGGELNKARDGFIGAMTIEQIKKYRFDLSFIGVVGVDVYHNQVTTYDMNDGLTKKEIINSSKRSYMLTESEKLNQDGNYTYASLADFTGIILEKDLNKKIENKIKHYGLEII